MFKLDQLKDLHWRELDVLFTFCRRKLFENPKYRYGPLRVWEVVNQVYNHVKKYTNINGANYCEVGCGIYHPFGVATIMYLNGAHSITVVDKNNSDLRRSAEALYDLLVDCSNFSERWFWSEITYDEYHQRLNDFNLGALQSGNLFEGLKNINNQYIVKDILNVERLENEIDILSSRATLEHFEFFEQGISALYKFMSKNGVAFHLIDLRDHRAYYSKDYNFRSFLTQDGSFADFNCNRLRASEILSVFERTGYKILDTDLRKEHIPEAVMSLLLPKYKKMSLDDLETVSMLITAKKSFEEISGRFL